MDQVHPPRMPTVTIDVAVENCDCSVPGCVRTVFPGELLHLVHHVGQRHVGFALCPVHAAEQLDDNRRQARLWLHTRAQLAEGKG